MSLCDCSGRGNSVICSIEKNLQLLPSQLWAEVGYCEAVSWLLSSHLPGAEPSCLGLGVVPFSCSFILFQYLYYCRNPHFPAPQAARDSLGALQRNRTVTRVQTSQGHCSGGERQEHIDSPDAMQHSWCWLCSAFQQPTGLQQAYKRWLELQSFPVDLLIWSRVLCKWFLIHIRWWKAGPMIIHFYLY